MGSGVVHDCADKIDIWARGRGKNRDPGRLIVTAAHDLGNAMMSLLLAARGMGRRAGAIAHFG